MPARHHEAQREKFAQALAAGETPEEAARVAGYPKGSSFAANARKRAQRADDTGVKSAAVPSWINAPI
jgi:hypothetical protein